MDEEEAPPERFPYLLLLLPIGVWLAFAGWEATTGNGFLESLIWPGLGVLAGTLVVAILGWKLDID